MGNFFIRLYGFFSKYFKLFYELFSIAFINLGRVAFYLGGFAFCFLLAIVVALDSFYLIKGLIKAVIDFFIEMFNGPHWVM